jgi:hypothetical protein
MGVREFKIYGKCPANVPEQIEDRRPWSIAPAVVRKVGRCFPEPG